MVFRNRQKYEKKYFCLNRSRKQNIVYVVKPTGYGIDEDGPIAHLQENYHVLVSHSTVHLIEDSWG